MKHFVAAVLLFAGSISFSSMSLAQNNEPAVVEAVPNGVITSISVTPANGGINPAFAGIRIKGTIKAGGNACQAQQYKAEIRKEVTDGVTYFVPVLETIENVEPVFCILSYDLNFKGLAFDQTFVLENAFIPSAFVVNVNSVGNNVSVGDLMNQAFESCSNIPRFCTKQFDPQVCTYGDITVRGGNKCEAMSALKSSVCSQELATFVDSEASCRREMSELQ
jgi:hypothetical protein